MLFGNFWIYRIYNTSPLIFFAVVAATVLAYLLVSVPGKGRKFLGFPFLVLIALLLFFQGQTTLKRDLTHFTNDQVRVKDMRLREYPSRFLRLGHWFEERPEFVSFFRMQENLSETVDPNLYFFGNHPRERVGLTEFEKFPFLYLPLFVFGVFVLVDKKKYPFFALSFFLPLAFAVFWGSDNSIGQFSFFPFFAVCIWAGMNRLYEKIH